MPSSLPRIAVVVVEENLRFKLMLLFTVALCPRGVQDLNFRSGVGGPNFVKTFLDLT
uniref:Uncharacterized protein n=1 Tax=Moniliophthora roreri TaxID=221103 RepID=A0A0W0EWL5_MONRR